MENKNYKKLVDLHLSDDPIILYNCWNTQSAKLIEKAGAEMNATSSYAVADSLGYNDGENVPFSILLEITSQMVKKTNIPLSIDIETGYGETGETLLSNILSLLKAGVVGINIEDRLIGEGSYVLRDADEQANRIKRICDFVELSGYNLFINARTDIFLQETKHSLSMVEYAIERCHNYYKAGAKCIFVPGLTDINLIKKLVIASPLPVNIMLTSESPTIKELAEAGVKRISYGPSAYLDAFSDFDRKVGNLYANTK